MTVGSESVFVGFICLPQGFQFLSTVKHMHIGLTGYASGT